MLVTVGGHSHMSAQCIMVSQHFNLDIWSQWDLNKVPQKILHWTPTGKRKEGD
jgi:hypothetical protein